MVNPTVRVEMWGVSNFLHFVLLSRKGKYAVRESTDKLLKKLRENEDYI